MENPNLEGRGKYSEIYQTSPYYESKGEFDNISDQNSLGKDSKVKKIALALYDIRKYSDFDDAQEDAKKLLNVFEQQPNVREDKIALAKQRLKSGYYFNRAVLCQTVDKLLSEMGL